MAAYDRDAALIKDWHVRNPIGLVRRMGSEVLFGPADRYAHVDGRAAASIPVDFPPGCGTVDGATSDRGFRTSSLRCSEGEEPKWLIVLRRAGSFCRTPASCACCRPGGRL